ncbi:MAG: hypothetical protein HQ505_06600 [Nitrosopumilus sp.]|nr:hypothetical protein [Nitrosopumilus sp.]
MRVQFNIKIEESDLILIHKIAKKRGQGASDFTRIAIRKELARLGFLKKEEAKALEVII